MAAFSNFCHLAGPRAGRSKGSLTQTSGLKPVIISLLLLLLTEKSLSVTLGA